MTKPLLATALLLAVSAPLAVRAASSSDTTFVNTLSAANTAEIMAARTALKQTNTPVVRTFANKMIADHTLAGTKLQTVAAKLNIAPTQKPDAADASAMQKMSTLSGAAFDKAYMSSQIADHQKVMRLLQNETQSGGNAQLKSLAKTMEPTIENHLQMAQAAAKTVGATQSK